jgi:CrcB protein
MWSWFAVGLGGALGSMARHAVNRVVLHSWPTLTFPIATTMVNVLGCIVIGVLAGLASSGRIGMTPFWRELVIVGFIGGFTTFSTFGLETVTLLRSGAGVLAVLSVVVQLAGGLAGVYLGLLLGVRLTAPH